jgi:hypothetical protein
MMRSIISSCTVQLHCTVQTQNGLPNRAVYIASQNYIVLILINCILGKIKNETTSLHSHYWFPHNASNFSFFLFFETKNNNASFLKCRLIFCNFNSISMKSICIVAKGTGKKTHFISFHFFIFLIIIIHFLNYY